ncbi:uncharacterized protein EAF01_007630 [Botrytis porri]|uniref:Uncharacterized protein n=1 Tax=Botrytis porri TaxID=87229 RepID=A0A4Z1KPJ7_9HELO|nr:uncharacterized protein EAF01_007630 [Botrytis porri]KAF7900328.1 hypothetical protein EAF01_007630 [Botrytis porri]TGO83349.1 hypothetical protein BPOR_0660g00020 [Botrytis porri]
MNPNLGKLYYAFTTRPKEMTAWEMEDWVDGQSKRTGRGFYVPKGEIFCRVLNQNGILCKNTKNFGTSSILVHYKRYHVVEYHTSAPRSRTRTKEQAERSKKCFEQQVLQVLRANNINENGTWEELTEMIKRYELREKQLGSKKATQIRQAYDASEANEQDDAALISIRRPVAEVFSTVIENNAKLAKSITAMGKATEMEAERQKMVSPRKRAVSDIGKEGIEKRARTEEKTSLSAGGTIENNPQ